MSSSTEPEKIETKTVAQDRDCGHDDPLLLRGCPGCNRAYFKQQYIAATAAHEADWALLEELKREREAFTAKKAKTALDSEEQKQLQACHKRIKELNISQDEWATRANTAKTRGKAEGDKVTEVLNQGGGTAAFDALVKQERAARKKLVPVQRVAHEVRKKQELVLVAPSGAPAPMALDRTKIKATFEYAIREPLGWEQYALDAANSEIDAEQLFDRNFMSVGATMNTRYLGIPSGKDAQWAGKSELDIIHQHYPEVKPVSKDDIAFFMVYLEHSSILLGFFRANSSGVPKKKRTAVEKKSESLSWSEEMNNPPEDETEYILEIVPLPHHQKAVIPPKMPIIPQDCTFASFLTWLREWEHDAGGEADLLAILDDWLDEGLLRRNAITDDCASFEKDDARVNAWQPERGEDADALKYRKYRPIGRKRDVRVEDSQDFDD